MTVSFTKFFKQYTGQLIGTHRSWAGRLYLVVVANNKVYQVESNKAKVIA